VERGSFDRAVAVALAGLAHWELDPRRPGGKLGKGRSEERGRFPHPKKETISTFA
jgi:hypothetical protein